MISATVIGNVGSSELKFTNDGTAVLEFSVASNSRHKTKDGYKDVATWVRCSMFGKRAETLAQHIVKGTSVAARGALSMREYEKKEGGKGVSLECRVDDVMFTGKREQSGDSAPSGSAQPRETRTSSGQRPQGGGQNRGGGGGRPSQDDYSGGDYGGGGATNDDIPFEPYMKRCEAV